MRILRIFRVDLYRRTPQTCRTRAKGAISNLEPVGLITGVVLGFDSSGFSGLGCQLNRMEI